MLSLAGKFFTSLLPPSINRIETSLKQQWSEILSGGFKVTPFDEHLILFDFEEEEDAKKVTGIEVGPWNVDGVILVLKEYPLETWFADIDFSVTCFWVKAEGLPLSHYTRQESEKIAKKLTDKPLIHKYIDQSKRDFWVNVEVNLRKPLKAGYFSGGDQRKPHFVQFKYKNSGKFCQACGKIDHTHCGKTPKGRPLTRKFWTKTYGPWLRYDWFSTCYDSPSRVKLKLSYDSPSRVMFKFDFSEKKPVCESTTYKQQEAELLVEFKIDVVYGSEQEWRGKTLISLSFVDKDERHCFRLTLSLLISKSISDYTRLNEILSSEIEEVAPLVGLRFCEKDRVIDKFLDYLVRNKKKWSRCRRRFVPLRAYVTKQFMIPIVECETMLQERRDDELHDKINLTISELIKTRVERNENLLSVPQWMESIKEALRGIGATLVESELVQRAEKASNEAIEMELFWRKGPKPADRRKIEELETVKVLKHEMCSCTICKEEMFLGEEATRMPCSHLYHEQCLHAWLKTSNSCPLCRFQLPT